MSCAGCKYYDPIDERVIDWYEYQLIEQERIRFRSEWFTYTAEEWL